MPGADARAASGVLVDFGPEPALGGIGTPVSLTIAGLRDGAPLVGGSVRVYFVSGPNAPAGHGNSPDFTCDTGADGACTISYTPAAAGTDVLCAVITGGPNQCDEPVGATEWDDNEDVVAVVVTVDGQPPIPAITPAPTTAPTATPAPTTDPTATPAPDPTATPVPDPTATPVPDPTAPPIEPVGTSAPTPTPVPDPTATPVPVPTATPVPNPTATPAPNPTATAVPNPTATPAPNPTATPAPNPTATPAPNPTPTPVPNPTATPAPIATPAPDPTATPVPDPDPATTPAPDPATTPAPDPNATPGPAASPATSQDPNATATPAPRAAVQGPTEPTNHGTGAGGGSGSGGTDSGSESAGAVEPPSFFQAVLGVVSEQVGSTVKPEAVAALASTFTFPIALAAIVVLFLIIQRRLDERDPKLRYAPSSAGEAYIEFEEEDR